VAIRLEPSSQFAPTSASAPPHEAFEGTLVLAAAPFETDPPDLVTSGDFPPEAKLFREKDLRLFPPVRIPFLTEGADLVPLTQDVIRSGTAGSASFWDLLVQPGSVWSDAGDGDWSRAGFPFALVHSLDGVTYNGLARFSYRRGEVSSLRFQIVQQTGYSFVETSFTACGEVPAVLEPGPGQGRDEAAAHWRAVRAGAFPTADWGELAAAVGEEALAGFEGDADPAGVLLTGLVRDGVLYRRECASPSGAMPYTDRMRFGVWSVIKTACVAASLLRLAQVYGESVYDERLTEYVPATVDGPLGAAWERVTFGNLLDMASGISSGSDNLDPNDSGDGYLDPPYWPWYTALTLEEKIRLAFPSGEVKGWGPGAVVRYRDEDMFLLGVAMSRYLAERGAPYATVWEMLEAEVFRPIGILDAPTARSVEADGSPGHPHMVYGWFPTIGDLARVAALFHARGRHGDEQLLHGPSVERLLCGEEPALPANAAGVTYGMATWHVPYGDRSIPSMNGWGGNHVAMFPNGMTGIRVAKSFPPSNVADMAAVADRLEPFEQ
jgi:hypothetical protein